MSLRNIFTVASVALIVSISAYSASSHAQEPPPVPKGAGICDREYAQISDTPADLQSMLDRCDWNTDGFVLALRKLNRLTPPVGLKPLVLRPRVDGRPVLAATYAMDVFFNPVQAYPHPLAFAKLEQLVEKISQGYEVKGIEIVGYADPNERQELGSMELDSKRAEFLRKYFIAVGVQPERLKTSVSTPRHGNTDTGRARDRSVEIKVYVLRQD